MSTMQNNENNVQKNAAAQADQQKEQERKDTLAKQQKIGRASCRERVF